MPQSIHYSNNPQNDFKNLISLMESQLTFGMIHEDTANDIEETMFEIFDNDCLYEIFDNADDRFYVVKVFRNSIFCHTNHRDLDIEEINQMIIDYSKE